VRWKNCKEREMGLGSLHVFPARCSGGSARRFGRARAREEEEDVGAAYAMVKGQTQRGEKKRTVFWEKGRIFFLAFVGTRPRTPSWAWPIYTTQRDKICMTG
jgi:hypothetical protein